VYEEKVAAALRHIVPVMADAGRLGSLPPGPTEDAACRSPGGRAGRRHPRANGSE